MSSWYAFSNALALGAIFALVALGNYLSFRIARFPDLTCDGAYALGACSAVVVNLGVGSAGLGLLAAFLAGSCAGLATASMYTRLHFPPVVAGILVVAAAYSLNLLQLGAPNRSIAATSTVFAGLERWIAAGSSASGARYATYPACLIAVAALMFLGSYRLLASELGLRLRCVGAHTRLPLRLGIDAGGATLLTLGLANGLIGLAGGLLAQYQRFADVNMGTSILMVGLASVFLGQALESRPGATTASLARQLAAVFAASLLYRVVIAAAYDMGLPTSTFSLVTALLLFAALLFPGIRSTWSAAFQRK